MWSEEFYNYIVVCFIFVYNSQAVYSLIVFFSTMITSEVVHLVSGVPIEMEVLISVLYSWNIEALKWVIFISCSLPSELSKHF